MVALRAARREDADRVSRFLHEHMNPDFEPDKWRRLFAYPWLEAPAGFGCIAEDAGRVVGYLGALYAERRTQDCRYVTGNLSSWYVERPYRGPDLAVSMLRMAMADPAVTYTVFSSRPRVLRLMRRAGLRELDGARLVWQRRRGSPQRRRFGATPVTAPELDGSPRRILSDHDGLDVKAWRGHGDSGKFTVYLTRRTTRRGAARYEVLGVDDGAAFARHAQDFADSLLPDGEARLRADSRLVVGHSAGASLEPLAASRYYRPGTAEHGPLDLLYSEIVLLDLKLM